MARGCVALGIVLAAPAQATPVDPGEHVLDYAIIGGSVLGLALTRGRTPAPARLGPVYDPKRPEAILSPRHADTLGQPHQTEQVSSAALSAGVGLGSLAAAGLAAVAHPEGEGVVDLRRLHHGLVGYAEALSLTMALTEVTKVSVGRLRPDFQDRVRRAHCAPGAAAMLPAEQCVGVPTGGRDLVTEGRRSFFSGHASAAFATAGFLSLQLGGRFVWGAEATPRSRWAGIAGQVVLMGAATWVAWTRVADDRHHPSDVITGAAVGFACAQLGYWRFFDGAGLARGGGLSLGGGPSGLPGLGVVGAF